MSICHCTVSWVTSLLCNIKLTRDYKVALECREEFLWPKSKKPNPLPARIMLDGDSVKCISETQSIFLWEPSTS